jgi:hypothetical protein
MAVAASVSETSNRASKFMAVSDFLQGSGKVASKAAQVRGTSSEPKPAPITPEEEFSLAREAGQLALGGMTTVGNLFDVPGSMVRDVLTWIPGGIKARNPLDQLLSPLSSDNRTTEAELWQSAGLQSKGASRTWTQATGRFAANLGLGIVADPLSYVGVGLAGRAVGTAGKIAKKAGMLDRSMDIAGAGKRVSSQRTTLGDLVAGGGFKAKEKLIAANRGKPIDDLLDQPLGGLATVKLPFMEPKVLGTGETAQRIAGALDTVGEAVRFGQYSPVRYVAPLFSKASRGAQSGDGQRFAINQSEDMEGAIRYAREQMIDPIRKIEESQVLKGPRALDNSFNMLEWLENIEPEKPPIFNQIQKQFDDEIVQITQGVPPDKYTPQQVTALQDLEVRRESALAATGWDGKPKLNAETAPLEKTLETLRDSMKLVYQLEKDAGVAIEKLDDPIEYFARLRQVDSGPMRAARDRNSFAPSDAFTLGRDPSMRGMVKGTVLLQKMSIDPDFAGMKNVKGWNPDMKKELRSQWRAKYGLTQQDTMFAGDEWQQNTDRLFDKIVSLDRKQVENGIPMFATNPAEVALRRMEAGVRAASAAVGVRKFINHFAKPASAMVDDDTAVPLSSLFGTAQSSPINQGHNAAKQMMVRELGDLADIARADLFAIRKQKLLPEMVKAQMQAMGFKKAPKSLDKKISVMLQEWEKRTGEKYDTIDEFFGPDWEVTEMAKIGDDEVLGMLKVPKHVAEDASRVIKAFGSPEEVSKLVAAGDAFINWFKTNVTATAPSFHVRNGVSGGFQNVVGGAIELPELLRTYAQALALIRGKAVKGAGEFMVDPMVGKKMADDEATDLLQREIFSNTLLDSPGQHNDLVASAAGSVAQQIPGARPISEMFKSPEGTTKLQQINPLASQGVAGGTDRFFAARWGRGVGNIVESMNRVSAYIGLRKQGYNAQEAAARVKELHVDYSNLTDGERRVMRRLFPFYSFTKGMVSMVTKELTEKPGGALAQTMRGTNMLKGGNATTPDYVMETTSIPLGQQEDGSDRYITGLGLMHEMPLGMFPTGLQDAGLTGLAMLNPLVKAPLEYATGQSFFQQGPDGGRPLKDVDPLLGRIGANLKQYATGEPQLDPVPTPRWLEVAASNSPLTRYLSMFRQATDTRKSTGDKALGLLSGVRVQDISPQARAAILRERSDQVIMELGAQDFVRTYIPDSILAAMSPEEKQKALRWQALQKKLEDDINRTKKEKQQENTK